LVQKWAIFLNGWVLFLISLKQKTTVKFNGFLQNNGVIFGLWWLSITTLLWPALLNGQYLVFYDTLGYMAAAARAFFILFGFENDWSQAFGMGLAYGGGGGGLAIGAAEHNDAVTSAARSIYYGVFIFAGALLGSLWVSVLFQVAVLTWAICLAFTQFFPHQARLLPLIILSLGVFTSLPFFASYLMPDFATGVTILASSGLLTLNAGLRSARMWQWLALLSLSISFHSSHLAITVIYLVVGTLLTFALRRRLPFKAALTLLVAICIGIGLQSIFKMAAETALGESPVRPPFLMARTISDGPGYDFLVENCSTVDLVVCQFLPVLPMGSDEFLWSNAEGASVVGTAPPEIVRALSDEEMAFVMMVLRNHLGDQLRASFSGAFQQLYRFGLGEFGYTDSMHRMFVRKSPPDVRAEFEASRLYRGTFPLKSANWLTYIVTSITFGVVVVFLLPARGTDDDTGMQTRRRNLILFCLLILGGILSNAAITGILSTPHDRYQARVIWLLPLLAQMALIHWMTRAQHDGAPT
tara:strand:+ start:715 stop:2292 length:1578 start_codon:yes stop_codon:yes gene_type:complete